MAFSTASAPVLTMKKRGVPAGAMRAERGLDPERQRGLVLGVGVARGHEGQAAQHAGHHLGVVLAEGLGGDERAEVHEAVGLAARVAVDGGQVGPDALGRVEGDRERAEEAVPGGVEGRLAGRQVAGHGLLEQGLGVGEAGRHVDVDLAGPVAGLEGDDPLEVAGRLRPGGADGIDAWGGPGGGRGGRDRDGDGLRRLGAATGCGAGAGDRRAR